VPLSQPGKATNVQRSTLNARPPTTESAKTSPKVEIAVAKEAAAVSAPAEGPNQKSKATAKTGVAKTSTVESTAVHVNTAQVSAAKAATSENKTAAKSSPKVEIAVAKPTAAKGDQKIEAKVSSPVAVTSGNTKVAGTKNSVTENNGTHTSPGLADATRKDQKAEIRGQSNAAAATAVASHKETTVTASAKPMRIQNSVVETTIAQPINNHFDTAFTKLADGFDFPVGKPDAQGYYKARGFRSRGHLGEDWDGVRGGDTDLGDPIYCVGDGLVVFARDCHMGWGNVLIVRHSYREGGTVKTVDSLYGHLQSMLVHRGQAVARGQKIATMGNAHGLYDAHLHLEIRKNLEIGMSRAAFAQDFSNYYDPTQFIQEHRHLQTGGGSYRVAMNTFTRDARIKWDKARNYSHAHTGGGSSQSAAALKKAVAAQH